MEWIFLEALVALAVLVGIVAWTMAPGRRKPPDGTTDDSRGTRER